MDNYLYLLINITSVLIPFIFSFYPKTKFFPTWKKLFPGFIGGHCVIPNLELINNQTLDMIKKMNISYSKKIKNAKSINKKYQK